LQRDIRINQQLSLLVRIVVGFVVLKLIVRLRASIIFHE